MGAPIGHRGAQGEALADRPELTAHQQALDEWQRAMWRRCGAAIAWWLEARGRLNQPITSLRLHELEGMAWAAVGAYSEAREEKRRELGLPPHVDPAKPDPLDRFLTG